MSLVKFYRVVYKPYVDEDMARLTVDDWVDDMDIEEIHDVTRELFDEELISEK